MKTRPDNKLQTESSYSSNANVNKVNGVSSIAREEQKDIKVSLYDIDYAILWHIQNVIKPTFKENEQKLPVPVMMASGEKWAMVQKNGYIRDNQDKIIAPLIIVKRTDIERRDSLNFLNIAENADSRYVFENKYSKRNKYDTFDLNTSEKKRNIYSVAVPKYYNVSYDVLLWTDKMTHLNAIIEQFVFFDGKAFGDTHKFITEVDPPSTDTTNEVGEDRIIRATIGLRVKGFIMAAQGPTTPLLNKIPGVRKIIVGMEIDEAVENYKLPYAKDERPTTTNVIENIDAQILKTSIDALRYLNSNYQVQGVYVDHYTAVFNAGWLSAPKELPATSVSNFFFYKNSQLIPTANIISFTQLNGVSTLLLDSNDHNFRFNQNDSIIAVGKFNV